MVKFKPKQETIVVSKKTPQERAEVWIRKEIYGQAPEQFHFVLANGQKLKDLKELTEALEKIPDEVFRHHVNETKNDFSIWVKDILKEDFLADELKKFNTRLEEQLTVQKYLNNKMERIIKKLAK